MAKRKKNESMAAKLAVMSIGFFLLMAVILLTAACLGYHAEDAGYNIASSKEVKNFLGTGGAITADFVLTWFGFALPIFLAAVAVWGYEIIRYKTFVKCWWRVFAWCLGLLFMAVFMSLVWGRVDNLKVGGNIGDFFSRQISSLVERKFGFAYSRYGLEAVGAFLAWVSFNFACGITFGSWWRVIKKIVLAVWSGLVWLCHSGKKICHAAKGLHRIDTTKEKAPRRRKEPKFKDDEIEPEEKKTPAESVKVAKVAKKIEGYNFPSVELLGLDKNKAVPQVSQKELEKIALKLEDVLKEFGVIGKIVQIRSGPVVTLYELEPAPGTKTARVIGLSDDIARSMSAVSVRIAVVPGSNTIGIEMPNPKRETVYLRDLVDAEEFRDSKAALTISLGKDIGGKNTYADLAKMPHLLVAGTTGSGKSVGVNSMIISLLYKMTPEECKLIMIDPKMLEFTMYNGIPHLLTPVITDPAKAVIGLKWAVKEMEDRYRAMAQLNVRNITGYNQKLEELRNSGEKLTKTVQTGFDMETGKPIYEEQEMDLTPMPYIVIVVDEMADLMLVAGKEVEAAIQRLAQMARAAGIHLIMSTQRPSVDVITGTIKANFPTRISYQVTSKIDSRTILGEQGAEQLLGMGDMLYMPAGQRPRRVHAPFVKDSEVEKIVEFIKAQRQPEYVEEVTQGELESSKGGDKAVFDSGDFGSGSDEDLYRQAVQIVQTDKKASTSYVQRRLRIGYNRAASIIDRMEQEGIITPADHVGRREVI